MVNDKNEQENLNEVPNGSSQADESPAVLKYIQSKFADENSQENN